jgi:biopolymer transport protein ExbD
MRFPHNAKIFRGQLDAAPFAGVFFLLLMLLLLQSGFVFTPGIPIQLPLASELPGTDRPSVSVAIDSGGILYYQNQIVTRELLRAKLVAEMERAGEPLTMVIQADKQVRLGDFVGLNLLAREIGMQDVHLATRPIVDVPAFRF